MLTFELGIRNINKVRWLLAAIGLVSGLITTWFDVSTLNRSFEPAGLIFALGVLASLALARSFGWLSISYPIKRWVLFGFLISAAGPVVFWAIELAGVSFEAACDGVSTRLYCLTVQSSDLVSLALVVVPTAIVSVASVSAALWILTQKWLGRELGWLLIAAIGAIFLSVSATYLLQDIGTPIRAFREDWTFLFILAALGYASLGAVSGSWIMSASAEGR